MLPLIHGRDGARAFTLIMSITTAISLHPRRALLQIYPRLKQDFLESELAYIAEVLEVDSKNYHAWSHRQWLIQNVNDEELWNRELDFGK